MVSHMTIRRSVPLFVVVAAISACVSPSAPGSLVKSVKVSGDTSMTTTDASQYTAATVKADGTSDDVTTRVTWTSSKPEIASVAPTGMVTAVSDGTVSITATYQGISGTLKTTVSPLVVFAIGGAVSEVGFGAIAGARVQVIDGPSSGSSAMTDAGGTFLLRDVRAGVKCTLQTSFDGFVSDQRSIALTHDAVVNVSLLRTPPSGATARCRDRSWSFAADRTKACVGSSGVAYWVCPGPLC